MNLYIYIIIFVHTHTHPLHTYYTYMALALTSVVELQHMNGLVVKVANSTDRFAP